MSHFGRGWGVGGVNLNSTLREGWGQLTSGQPGAADFSGPRCLLEMCARHCHLCWRRRPRVWDLDSMTWTVRWLRGRGGSSAAEHSREGGVSPQMQVEEGAAEPWGGDSCRSTSTGAGPSDRWLQAPDRQLWRGVGKRAQRRKDRVLQAVGWPSLLWTSASRL